MRDIKFRGESVDLKKWIYGYLFITHKSNPDGEKTYWIFNEYGKYKVKPETAGQYTGLKDKNDKEIYEGDIVSDGDIEDRETYVVESMLELYYAVIYSEQHSGNGYFTRKDIEIIGNIHEVLR